MKETTSGNKVANLEIEVERYFPNTDGTFEKDVFSVTLWKELAEKTHKNCKVGSYVEIKGRLSAKKFNTKNESNFYYSEIVGDNLKIISV